MIRFRNYLWYFTILFVFFFSTVAESAIPRPARTFGTVTVDGTVLTQDTDDGYTFEVTREEGTSYVPAAELTDGLNCTGGYSINVPLYDADYQPEGANPGDTAVMHVYKDGSELAVTSPVNGRFTVGEGGSINQINLSVDSLQPTRYQLTATVTGGNGTISPTSGTYDEGTVVTLTATPDTGYRVQEWNGTNNNSSTANTNTVTMNSDRSVTVQFEEIPPTQYQLSASVPGGHGTISPTSGTYNEGTVVTLTASPETGYRVQGWSGTNNNSSTATTNTVTMDSDRIVTVQFEEIPPTQYQLSASVPGGHGTISPTSGTYNEGTVVTLTASPETGYRVQGWSGTNNNSSTATTNTVTMDSDRIVTVQFEEIPPTQYQLSASVTGGHGTISPTSGTYNEGTVVTLTATPDTGYRVQGWSGTNNNSSTVNTNTVTMNSNRTVTIQFEEIPPTQYQLTATVPGGHGTISPTSGTYNEGTVVTLTAAPETGYRVQGWSGTNNNSSTATTNTVTMNSNRSVTVQFEEIPPTQYQLSASVTGGNGTISPTSGTYNEGTVVTLTATPDTGYRVQGWSGTNNDSSTANTNTVTMNSNRSVTVQFAQTAPAINLFSATPGTISEGEFVTLSWNITGATSATIDNGVGAVVTTSGSAQDAPTITTTYTLTASNPAGTVTRGVTVTVVQGGAVIDSFTAAPEEIDEGESATLSWNISDADSATIDNDIGPVDPLSGSLEVTPLSTTTYTLTATNGGGSVISTVTVMVSELLPPEIVETIPHHGAGINDSTRVPNRTSFCVRIEDSDGIDITDPSSIMFTIDDGIYEEYTRDLGDYPAVRVIKLTEEDDTQVTKLWVAYSRFAEDELEDYDYDIQINFKVDVKDITGLEMTQENYSIKIETQTEHENAEAGSPRTSPLDSSDPDLEDPEYNYNAGVKVTSGKLKGAKIIYNSNELVKPRFGPIKEIPSLDAESEGIPMNLTPPNVFDTPVKLFIPYRGISDVSEISVFLYTGNRWVLACDASGNVEHGGEGWMVPGSRVNHNKGQPSTVEIKVYHFSGVLADSGTAGTAGTDSSNASCFIKTVRH